jgi:hypothetical protein
MLSLEMRETKTWDKTDNFFFFFLPEFVHTFFFFLLRAAGHALGMASCRLSVAPMMEWTDRHYRFLARMMSAHTKVPCLFRSICECHLWKGWK